MDFLLKWQAIKAGAARVPKFMGQISGILNKGARARVGLYVQRTRGEGAAKIGFGDPYKNMPYVIVKWLKYMVNVWLIIKHA